MGPARDVTTRIGAALTRAVRRHSARIARDLPAAMRGDRKAIHDVRVASRRLRAALPIAGEAAGVDVRAISREVRRVTRALGAAREADVVQRLIGELPRGDGWGAAAVAHMEARCARWRGREHRAARAVLARFDTRHLVSRAGDLAGRLESTGEAAMTAAFVAETRRRTRVLADAIDEAGIVYAVEPLHRLRIAGKQLRYVLETGSRAMPGIGGRATRRLRTFQSGLGRLHDLQMAQRYVRAAAAEQMANPALGVALARLDRVLEVECRRIHARAMKARAGLKTMVREVERAAAALLTPQTVGRMARMRVDARGPRVAAR